MINRSVCGMVDVDRIAASRRVEVAALVARSKPVVGGVVEPAETQGGPAGSALGRVVEHDVEDHLQSGARAGRRPSRGIQRPDRPLAGSAAAEYFAWGAKNPIVLYPQ